MNQSVNITPREQRLLREVLLREFEPRVFSRARGLYSKGKVGAIERREEPATRTVTFDAKVVGSRGHTYQASLGLDLELGSVFGFCSCPYAYDCKHSLAIGLVLVSKKASAVTKTAKPADWLKAFQSALAPGNTEVQPKSWRLCYLVHLHKEEDFAALALAQRYRKQSGGWGRLQSLSPIQVERQHSLLAADRQLLSLLPAAEPVPVRVGSAYLEHCYEAKGALGRQVIEWALRSGRALDMETFRPWHWGAPITLSFEWRKVKGGQRLEPRLEPEPEGPWRLLDNLVPPLYRLGSTLGPADTELEPEPLALIRQMPPVSAKQKTEISAQLQHRHQKLLADEEALPEIRELSEPVPGIRLLGVDTPATGLLPALRFQVYYGDLCFTPGYDQARAKAMQTVTPELMEGDEGYIRLSRDWGREAAWAQQLRDLSLVPYNYGGETGELWVPSEVQAPRHVLAWNRLLPALNALAEEEGWALEIDPSYRVDEGVARLGGEAKDAGHGWFDLKLNLSLEGTELDTETLLAQWLEADTPDTLVVQGEDRHWRSLDMRPLKPVLGLLRELYQGSGLDKPARLPSFKAVELEELEDINVQKAPALGKLRRDLKNFKGIKEVKPARHLNAELRDYQQQGLNWLMFLHRYGFGGVLADDMGLGKTLQTLAFLQRLKAGRKLTRGALVVAPTSLIWNWQREAERFTPNLRCLVLHGQERKAQFETMPEHDLVVTTYALIHRDFDVYADYPFDVAVLDEAQNIKNRLAKTTRRVKQLPADMRLCLTGTPLENHLGELWSITDYVLPGLLGDEEHFRQQFRQPIEQQGNQERAGNLSRRMAPFMLRRTKAEVVKELPAKTEMHQSVHLAGKQQALYESIRVSMEKRVRELIRQKGMAKSHIEFLDALLKLRQACIDPRLVKLKKAEGIEQSAKMDWLTDNLPEMVEEGRKVLLFSQFTQMLDLLERELKTLGIGSVKLTGRTRKREAAIQAFQEGPAPVFLISLKAGGAGLNLTAADTVIHVDPWWNPAVENQATDRAYRIGQDKPVFVYKLVAAGTVEEKIQAMQRDKQALADNLFDQSREAGLPGSGEELLELFQ